MLLIYAFRVCCHLSACGASTEPIGPDSSGFWDGVIIYNLSQFIYGFQIY